MHFTFYRRCLGDFGAHRVMNARGLWYRRSRHYRGPSQTGTAVPVTLSRTVVLFDPEDSKSLQCRATLTVTMAGGALSHSLDRTYTFAVPMDGNFTSKLECVHKSLALIGFFDKSL